MKKVLAIGSPLVDIIVNVPEAFVLSMDGEKGGMELVLPQDIESLIQKAGEDRKKRFSIGGSSANLLLGLLKLGYTEANFLGKLADDKNGQFYKNTFNSLGEQKFKYCSNSQTGSCLSLVTPDTQRTMRTYLGASSNLSIDDITKKDLEGVHHLHLEGYLLFNQELTYHILSLAKEVGSSISLDLSSFEVVQANKDVLGDLLKDYIDIVFANEDEAASFVGHRDIQRTLQDFSKYCSIAAVKLGEKGAHIYAKGEVFYQEAEKVNAVDSTGAGDLWASGFLYGYLQGKPWSYTLPLAAKLGGSVVQNIGAFLEESQWNDINLYK